MILEVAKLGNPILREKSLPVSEEELRSPEIQKLIDDMIETMRDHSGVGLAANQVHVAKRILVLESAGAHPRYPEAPLVPLQVLVNHEIIEASEEMVEDWEGCLSLPDLRGKVPRHRTIKIRALDREGRKLEFTAEDFHARVIQHEGDHLNGLVFLDRMTDLSSLAFISELHRIADPKEREAAEAA